MVRLERTSRWFGAQPSRLAGFGTAKHLSEQGYNVTLLDAQPNPGGLSTGFRTKEGKAVEAGGFPCDACGCVCFWWVGVSSVMRAGGSQHSWPLLCALLEQGSPRALAPPKRCTDHQPRSPCHNKTNTLRHRHEGLLVLVQEHLQAPGGAQPTRVSSCRRGPWDLCYKHLYYTRCARVWWEELNPPE